MAAPIDPAASGLARLLAESDAFIAARSVLWARLPRRIATGTAAVNPIRPHASVRGGVRPTDIDHAAATRIQLADGLRAVWDRLAGGRAATRAPLDEVADSLLDLAARHTDSLPLIAFARAESRAHPAIEHAIAAAALATAAAVELGWSRGDIRDAALTVLLADVGLAALTFDPFTLARPLSELEQSRMRSHGDLSALLASRIEAIPERVLLAISQHHERTDGRGTPRGIKSPAIHDLALLIGAADTLAALAAPRAHRPALLPHAALMQTAQLAREGSLDEPVTNALIRACGIFPPGSHIRLSTGDIGVVIARPRRREPRSADPRTSDPSRPVVRVMPDLGAASFAALGRPVTIDLGDDDLAAVSIVAEVAPEC